MALPGATSSHLCFGLAESQGWESPPSYNLAGIAQVN